MKAGDKILCKKASISSLLYLDRLYEIKSMSTNTITVTGTHGILLQIDKQIIKEYFYTPQELRKLKLEKLYENRR